MVASTSPSRRSASAHTRRSRRRISQRSCSRPRAKRSPRDRRPNTESPAAKQLAPGPRESERPPGLARSLTKRTLTPPDTLTPPGTRAGAGSCDAAPTSPASVPPAPISNVVRGTPGAASTGGRRPLRPRPSVVLVVHQRQALLVLRVARVEALAVAVDERAGIDGQRLVADLAGDVGCLREHHRLRL